jgi:hypothetical protein
VCPDPDAHLRELLQDLRDRVEDREAFLPDDVLVEFEVNLLRDLDLLVGDHDQRRLARAPGAVAVRRPGLVRTLIVHVEHGVLVVVRIGAAVGVFEPVGIFGLVGAFVDGVEDSVEIVVRLGATVVVEVAVLVLRLEHAHVARIEDAVAVGVLIVRWSCDDQPALGAGFGGRQIVGGVRVRFRDGKMVARSRDEALIELDLGELEVCLGESELARCAANRAVALGLARDLAQPGDLAAHDGALVTRREADQRYERDCAACLRGLDHLPAPRWASFESLMALSAYSSAMPANSLASE